MKQSAHRRRGQPAIVLFTLLGGWTAVRVLAWNLAAVSSQLSDASMAEDLVQPQVQMVQKALLRASFKQNSAAASDWQLQPADHSTAPDAEKAKSDAPPPLPGQLPDASWTAPMPALIPAPMPAPMPAPVAEPVPEQPSKQAEPRMTTMIAGGHQLLWLSAFSQLPMPAEVMARIAPTSAAAATRLPRWSADTWLLLRRGNGPAGLAAIGGSYGASQAGAVLRYRLAPDDPNRPAAYLRATAALNGMREQQAAFGLSARPMAKLPVVVMAELRATRSAAGISLRPAAALVSEFPPLNLPFKLRAEAYAQAGYVGGRDATAFADGQLRIDRKLFSIGPAELRAGAGAWGGAQKGAARGDVGPSASVTWQPGRAASARLSADWRFRIAGNAAPASGPAVTLSAGF